jgi:hypothetical protein
MVEQHAVDERVARAGAVQEPARGHRVEKGPEPPRRHALPDQARPDRVMPQAGASSVGQAGAGPRQQRGDQGQRAAGSAQRMIEQPEGEVQADAVADRRHHGGQRPVPGRPADALVGDDAPAPRPRHQPEPGRQVHAPQQPGANRRQRHYPEPGHQRHGGRDERRHEDEHQHRPGQPRGSAARRRAPGVLLRGAGCDPGLPAEPGQRPRAEAGHGPVMRRLTERRGERGQVTARQLRVV